MGRNKGRRWFQRNGGRLCKSDTLRWLCCVYPHKTQTDGDGDDGENDVYEHTTKNWNWGRVLKKTTGPPPPPPPSIPVMLSHTTVALFILSDLLKLPFLKIASDKEFCFILRGVPLYMGDGSNKLKIFSNAMASLINAFYQFQDYEDGYNLVFPFGNLFPWPSRWFWHIHCGLPCRHHIRYKEPPTKYQIISNLKSISRTTI